MKVVLVPGDGVGLEVSKSVIEISKALDTGIEFIEYKVGASYFEESGKLFEDGLLDSIKENQLCLKGPTATPIGGGFRSINVQLRQHFNLYANLRPLSSIEGVKSRYENVDLTIVRENSEDLYKGVEYMYDNNTAHGIKIITKEASERIIRFAFDYALKNNKKKVTCVHKANIMKLTDGLFLNTFNEIAKEYDSIESDSVIIDALCMKLVSDPSKFDVLVAPNLYGDIISDLCAGLVGGLGFAPSVNIGKDVKIYEAVHGSAPDIAGKDLANPTALLLSFAMLLNDNGMVNKANELKQALYKVIKEGKHTTVDIGGNSTCSDFTKEVCGVIYEKIDSGVFYLDGKYVENSNLDKEEGRKKTLAYKILDKHDNHLDENILHIKFDSLTSHDITYVGVIQTARASNLKQFPVPYVLTNCHNTLCAVGGTINEDDHMFAYSCAHKYGGIYVPPNMAVIHSYNREMMTKCGGMILGSDSHTRYGALGTLAIGEGGGEIAKQLLSKTYDIKRPEVVLVYVHGKLNRGVGPHDVALALCASTYSDGFVKNRVMEFVGPGIGNISLENRNAIDVMSTETTCLSTIWETDDKTKQYYIKHNRESDYHSLSAENGAYYDRCIDLNLDEIECMIALPMHPSYALPISELKKDPYKYLKQAQDKANEQLTNKLNLVDKIDSNGNIHVDQAIIAGCSGGTYGNICAARDILKDGFTGNGEFRLSIYPDSMPVYKALAKEGAIADIVSTGAIFREAFCGPCFGAGDTPANGELSIRHTTRNFPNREGSKPNEGQIASVALMDARSIAATSINKGILTAASDVVTEDEKEYVCDFDSSIYEKRVYNGYGKAKPDYKLHFGPNIKDWPNQPRLSKDLLIKIVSHIDDIVTTTDELIPSGETSVYRSNPLRLAEFTLSRRDPNYVKKAKEVQQLSKDSEEVKNVLDILKQHNISYSNDMNIGSAIYANKPGDGSAREQAASCQRVLGGVSNFALEYATKRYRSNCINWGMIPFITNNQELLKVDTWVLCKDVIDSIDKDEDVVAYVIDNNNISKITLSYGQLTSDEKQILKEGCLINYYKK